LAWLAQPGKLEYESVDQTALLDYLQRMPRLPIVTLPDPILRQTSAAVETVDDEVRSFASDMLETMYAAPGIGLAAVQLGVLRRILVLDTVKGEGVPKNPFVLINPEIVSFGDTPRVHDEGCLSIPQMYAEVERPALVRVRYVDLEGKLQERDFADLQATVVQHEIDHLEGILFIDHLSRLRRNLLIRKYHKMQRERAAALQQL
jgi:peptide deformylase